MSLRITKTKINNEIVKPPNIPKIPQEQIKGYDLFPEIYGLIYLVAKKKSGKTVTLFHIIKRCVTKDTTVIIFSSTINRDDVMKEIVKWLKAKGIEPITYTSILDNGVNQVQLLVNFLINQYPSTNDTSNSTTIQPADYIFSFGDTDTAKQNLVFNGDHVVEEVDTKKRKKKIGPDYMIIFDDISNELNDRWLTYLMKENRHFKTKIIISNQYFNDVAKDARDQIDYFLMYPKISLEKLEQIHSQAGLSSEFPVFEALYKDATKDKHNFLYVDVKNDEYRKNFSEKYQLELDTDGP